MGLWQNWQEPADADAEADAALDAAAPPARKPRRTRDTAPVAANEAAARRVRARTPLSRHPAFAPLLAVWAAVMGAGVVMVLPAAIIEGFAAAIPGAVAPQAVRLGLAGCIAALLALVALLAGRALRSSRRTEGRPIRARRGEVQPLDPASELGSDSLDAPLPAGLFARQEEEWEDAYDTHAAHDFADEAVVASPVYGVSVMAEPEASDSPQDDIFELPTAWLPEPPRDYDLAEEVAAEFGPARNSSPAPAPLSEQPAAEQPPAPRNLDLAAFGALPGRNAVWVEDPAADLPTPDQTKAQAPSAEHADAIARLRAVPPSELSLCQLVERFAAALHDYQAVRSAEAEETESRTEREALLQQALSALSRATGQGLDSAPAVTGAARRGQFWAEAQARRDARGAA